MSGTLTHSPSQIVQQLLVDLSQGTLGGAGGSWPVYYGQFPDDTTGMGSGIYVAEAEGIIHARSMLDGYVFEDHGINLNVRDTRYGDGRTKAHAIAIALDGVTVRSTVVSSSVYKVMDFRRTGGVLYLGREGGTARHLFSINGLLTVTQTS